VRCFRSYVASRVTLGTQACRNIIHRQSWMKNVMSKYLIFKNHGRIYCTYVSIGGLSLYNEYFILLSVMVRQCIVVCNAVRLPVRNIFENSVT